MTITSFFIAVQTALENMGIFGLFILAFIEASFFPLPPDLFLIPLTLLTPSLWWLYALVCTLGSTSGALFGYFIGKKGGRPLLRKIISKDRANKIDLYYKKYGDWALGISGFSPIPYKVFTITSGVFNHNLKRFILVSFISRGARFFTEAFIIMLFGQQIVEFLKIYWGLTTFVVSILLVLFYIIWIKWKKRSIKKN